MSDDNNGDFLSPMVHFGVYRDIPEGEWVLSTYKEEILMEEDESRCPNCGSMHSRNALIVARLILAPHPLPRRPGDTWRDPSWVENWSAWTNTELDLRLLDLPKRSPRG
jgi:hypothetical protein